MSQKTEWPDSLWRSTELRDFSPLVIIGAALSRRWIDRDFGSGATRLGLLRPTVARSMVNGNPSAQNIKTLGDGELRCLIL